MLFFFQVYSFFHLCSFLVVWGLGFWGLGFWGWGFHLMGFGACGLGPSGFFGVGALYIKIKELSWEKTLQSRCAFCNTSCRLPFGNSLKMCGQASNILHRINSRKLFMGNSTMAGLWDILCGYWPADPWNSTTHMVEYLVKSNQGFRWPHWNGIAQW